MVGKGKIRIDVLPDGRLRVETGDMAGPLHLQAEELLVTLRNLAGGDVLREKAESSHHHHDHHEHDHIHDGHDHTH